MNLHAMARLLHSLHKQQLLPAKPNPEYKSLLEARESVLARFHPAFTPDTIGELSESTFRDFLSFKHNHHWTGLQRPTKQVCDDMPKLRQSLMRLLDESAAIEDRIDSLSGGGEYSIKGLKIGILSPILLISKPQEYGVWNAKSESAMKKLNLWPDFKRGSTTGQKYSALNSIFQKLSQLTGLDLWSIDGLWHVLNVTSDSSLEQALADEEQAVKEFLEGKKTETSGYRYERNKQARKKCLDKYGTKCIVCEFDFFRIYGELGLGYIHVHHRTDLAVAGLTSTDPHKHLVPVCPNCHAMLHKGVSPARKIEDLKKIREEWAAEIEAGNEGQ